MRKLLLQLSFLGVSILFFFGLTQPESSVMWLASTSDNFAILRFIMMVVLGFLLITNPPRKMYFRVLVGLLAAGLTSWGIWATYQNQIGLG